MPSTARNQPGGAAYDFPLVSSLGKTSAPHFFFEGHDLTRRIIKTDGRQMGRWRFAPFQ